MKKPSGSRSTTTKQAKKWAKTQRNKIRNNQLERETSYARKTKKKFWNNTFVYWKIFYWSLTKQNEVYGYNLIWEFDPGSG